MRPFRTLLPLTLVFALTPGVAAFGTERPQDARDRGEVTRSDVLSGRASQEEAVELLRASIEAAGGETVGAAEAETLGGYAYPFLAVDLDGDADQEVLLSQYAEHRSFIVAADDRGVLWRAKQPKNSFLVGSLPADLSPAEGNEVLLVAYRYKNPSRALLAAAGADGVQWSSSLPAEWFEINGVVQADDDPSDEVTLSVWDEDFKLTMHTLDGADGSTISELNSSPESLLDRRLGSEGFVTDGTGNGPDEAVFITPLLAGFYAERLSLADGNQTTFEVRAGATRPYLYQAPDHTGDGRRDAFAEFGNAYGVFDASLLQTAWSAPIPEGGYGSPLRTADLNGDGGSELCFELRDDVYEQETYRTLESSTSVRCHAGATGAVLWERSLTVRSADQGSAYTYASADSDLDGDAVPDPILQGESYRCVETEEDYFCETLSSEATAFSGADGSALWTLQGEDATDAVWSLTDSDLDGAPGDDGFEGEYSDEGEVDPRFTVRNGLELTPSWSGAFDTGNLPGYADWGIGADVDGDGDNEAVATAETYEVLGDPECNGPCLYVSYAYVAAFEPGGELLWQLEL